MIEKKPHFPTEVATLGVTAAPAQPKAHTPGPWRVNRGAVVADAPAPGVGGSDDIAHYGGHLIAESINGPNARLIAAAPELHAALASLVETFHARPDILRLCGFAEHSQIKAACDALNKAAGL